MRTCTRFWGHKWESWTLTKSAPKKHDDQKLYRQFLQTRSCEICGFYQSEWLDEFKLVEEEKDKA